MSKSIKTTTTTEVLEALEVVSPIVHQRKDIIIAQANALTQARYDFSLIEKRAVYFIINEVRKQFIERIDGQRTLFDNLVIHIGTSFLSREDELREIYDALRRLRKKSVWVTDANQVLEVGFINYFEHEFHKSYIELEVSHKILPYLVELASHFTAYSLTVAISLKAKYSQRFYEYCSQYEHNDTNPFNAHSGYFYVTLNDLRRKLMLEDAYPRYALLKKRVIEPARKELKALYDEGQCNLYFEYTEDKYGRSIDKLHFYVYSKDSKKKPDNAKVLIDQIYFIRQWLTSWLAAKRRPKNLIWIDRVISHLNLNPTLIPKLYKRLAKLKTDDPKKNHAALARHIIEEDFLP